MTWLGAVALVIALGFWLAGVAWPVAAVLARASSAAELFDSVTLSIVEVTLKQAVVSVLISGLIGLPLGLWIGARTRGRGGAFVQSLLAVPFGVPTVVVATAWVVLLGRSGWLAGLGLSLDWVYSMKAVVLANVFLNAPWVALAVAQARQAVAPALIEAAGTLGGGRRAVLGAVVWPQVRWAFWGACAQALVLCAMSFTLVLVLGGGPPVQTLETALYSRLRYSGLEVSAAAACGFWELLICLVPWAVMVWFQSRAGRIDLSFGQRRERSRGLFWVATVGLLFIAPYFVVFSGKTWRAWANPEFWNEVWEPLLFSLKLAVSAALGTLLVAVCGILSVQRVRHCRSLSFLFNLIFVLPSAVSALVLGLGFWLAYGDWVDPFSGSLTVLVLIQVALFAPVVFRLLAPVAQDSPVKLIEAAKTLGASTVQIFLAVEWSRWKGPLSKAFAMILGASLAEVAAVSLFASEDSTPLPLLLARWMGQYRFDDAQALAALLFVLSGLSMLAVNLVWRAEE